MTLIYLSLFWLVGAYIGSHVHVSPVAVALLTAVPLAVGLLWRRDARVRVLAFCLVALAVASLRYQSALPPADYGSIALHVGPRLVEIGGVVVSEPDTRDRDMRLVVSVYHIGSGQDSFRVTGRVLVYVSRNSQIEYGDDLLIKGTLEEPPEFDTFSYKDYLVRQGIYAILYQPQVRVVAHDQGNQLLSLLYDVKRRLQIATTLYLPEPHAGLVQGVLLGVKAVLTEDLKQDLTNTGLIHIVVVSGYNLTVVATLMQRLAEKRLRRGLALLLALVGVVLFTLMTGATTPVVRAAVMVSMTILARAVGRESDALTSLLFTAALLVGINPLTLWDVSFQLSFLATLGLVTISPVLERKFERLPLGMGSILAVTLAAQIMTLPVIALNFQRISLISPLANVLVQPAIPLLMLLGAVTAVAGLTAHVAVRLAGWLTWLPGTYIVEIIRRLGSLPQASVDIPSLPVEQQPLALLVYYSSVAAVTLLVGGLSRSALRNVPQSLRTAAVVVRANLLIALLSVVATVLWVVILVLLKS